MTMTDPPLLPAPRPSLYERWSARALADPVAARRLAWLIPVLLTLVAGLARVIGLSHPHELVFDETYYVKDAWSQWNLGYSSTWPDGADAKVAAGVTDVFTTEGSFVVHPPLGKWLIGAGMALFGADSSFGWRIAVALAGTACVLVLFLLARTLTSSLAFASVAATLLAIDPMAIAMSRVSLLDTFLALFVLLAFWFALLDRSRHLDRLASGVRARVHDAAAPAWGPVLWNRPWLIAAGAAAGAASAVKWSGAWVLAVIGIYAVVSDALARRRLGVGYWPTDAVLRQGPAAFLLLVPVAFGVYLASWTGWLITDGGYARHSADASPATGVWSWVPLALQSLWRYHESIYGSMAGMSTPHSYASPAWQWPLLIRPTSMYVGNAADGEQGCLSANGCLGVIYSMPNPLVWWAAVAATLFLVFRFIVVREWRYAFVLVAIAATYVPWLFYPERTIFQFYTIVMLPFLLLALSFALREIASGGDRADADRRRSGQRVVWVFLGVAVALGVFWYTSATGILVPYDLWRAHNWLPGWI